MDINGWIVIGVISVFAVIVFVMDRLTHKWRVFRKHVEEVAGKTSKFYENEQWLTYVAAEEVKKFGLVVVVGVDPTYFNMQQPNMFQDFMTEYGVRVHFLPMERAVAQASKPSK